MPEDMAFVRKCLAAYPNATAHVITRTCEKLDAGWTFNEDDFREQFEECYPIMYAGLIKERESGENDA